MKLDQDRYITRRGVVKHNPVKSVNIYTYAVRYCDCPYCSITISDEINADVSDWSEGSVVECPSCHKKFRIRTIYMP